MADSLLELEISSIRLQIVGTIVGAHGRNGTMMFRAIRLDETPNSLVALKQIQLDSTDEAGRTAELKALEALKPSLLELNHPNVIRHIGCGIGRGVTESTRNQNFYYIVMEHGQGGSLANAVENNLVSGKRLHDWTRQILEGLSYIHSQNIVHRDIKPQNIVLSSNEPGSTLKICDMGDIKQLQSSVTQTREVSQRGTTVYMSPEMVQGTASDFNIGRKTDIWSFGGVLLYMITGKPPYTVPAGNCHQDGAMMWIIGTGAKPEIPNTVPYFNDFIRSCFATSPLERPDASELLSSLTQIDRRMQE